MKRRATFDIAIDLSEELLCGLKPFNFRKQARKLGPTCPRP